LVWAGTYGGGSLTLKGGCPEGGFPKGGHPERPRKEVLIGTPLAASRPPFDGSPPYRTPLPRVLVRTALFCAAGDGALEPAGSGERGRRSMWSFPFKWSISCARQRARRPSTFGDHGQAMRVGGCVCTRTLAARLTFPKAGTKASFFLVESCRERVFNDRV